jgi:predicted ATPase
MARLDRLGSAREVAQIGAVIGRDFSYPLLRAVAGMKDTPLQTSLDRLAEADILLVQGLPPDAEYRFKHALIQDAAYENLLKSRRQVLHRRVGEVLRDNFAAAAAAEPELLAHHFTQAGTIEAAIEWCGKAGQRSLERSALIEAAEQLTRALDQIATLPATTALRREQIKLQVALITPLIHVKGYAAPETRAAAERAHVLIGHAEALGEAPEDPLLRFSVLYAVWSANTVALNGEAQRELATQFLALAKKQSTTGPVMIGHFLMGVSLMLTGNIVRSRSEFDETIALYDPVAHRPLAAHFGTDRGVVALNFRARTLWLLGYPETALADLDHALNDAREIGQAGTLMSALFFTASINIACGNYTAATAQADELVALADEKTALIWKALGELDQGCLLVLMGKSSSAVEMIASGITAYRSTGSTLWMPLHLAHLAKAYSELGQFDEACLRIAEAMTAMETTRERWCEAEVHRIAGEVTLLAREPDTAKAQAYFDRALTVARQQQAKSWELRAATSLARLWRDQGKVSEACELLAPVYGWFTEGFDTRDLKDAKALLEQLS